MTGEGLIMQDERGAQSEPFIQRTQQVTARTRRGEGMVGGERQNGLTSDLVIEVGA